MGLFSRLKKLVRTVVDTLAEAADTFTPPDPPPSPPPTPPARAAPPEDDWSDLPSLAVEDTEADRRAYDLSLSKTENVLRTLKRNGMDEDVVESLRAQLLPHQPAWEKWFIFYLDTLGYEVDFTRGAVDVHTIAHADTWESYSAKLLYFIEAFDIVGIRVVPLKFGLSEGRPFYDDETLETTDGEVKGVGKRPPRSASKISMRHGRYSKEDWKKKQSRDRSREYRARKSEAREQEIRESKGEKAALEYRARVDRARRAKRPKGKKK